MRLIILLALGLFTSASVLHAEEKPDPRATVESALDHYIALIEKKDYARMLQECYPPAELKPILDGTTVEEFVKKINAATEANAKHKEALEALKELKTKTPVYNDEKTEAKYPEVKSGEVTENLVFVKEGELWYISLVKSRATRKSSAKSQE